MQLLALRPERHNGPKKISSGDETWTLEVVGLASDVAMGIFSQFTKPLERCGINVRVRDYLENKT